MELETIFLNFAAVWLAFCATLIIHTAKHQPTPYMDEIFHIPQAQQYCNGSFNEWDPKITTLPGLYLFSIGVLKPLGMLLGVSEDQVCSVLALRLVNLVFAFGNLYIIFEIIKYLTKGQQTARYLLIKTCALSLMPVLFFFNALYYTDTGSLFFCLFSYYAYLRLHYSLSAILGIVAILFRQTNIIWVFFMAICNVSKILKREGYYIWELCSAPGPSANAITTASKLTATPSTSHSAAPTAAITSPSVVKMFFSVRWLGILRQIAVTCWSYLMVGTVAVIFVAKNGGIVVGDKEQHVACFHAPQIGYFVSFTLFLSLPHLVTAQKLKDFLGFIKRRQLSTAVALVIALVLVHCFTYVHPFLLADNRHYPFYIWSKIYSRHYLVKYALVSVYLYAGWSINDSLSHLHPLMLMCLWTCVSAAVVPQRLMEFRYFLMPYILTRLHMKEESIQALLCELLLYAAINSFVFYNFLYRPIFWPKDHTPHRIMW